MKRFFLALFVLLLAGRVSAAPPTSSDSSVHPPTPITFDLVERRAFDYFWRESDAKTGLTKDRATNVTKSGDAPADAHTVASIAATGYALAALPVGVSRGWVSKPDAYARALTTLRFLHDHLFENHGFYYHFVDRRTGARVWNSEVSSIDTALLALGALAAGDYWPHTPVQTLARSLVDRIDWRWMQNSGGAAATNQVIATAPSMGWTPERGFLPNRWQGYSEAACLYWLGMGVAAPHDLSALAYHAWTFPMKVVDGRTVFGGPSPLFMAQMAPGFFPIHAGQRDMQGRDWGSAWTTAHRLDAAYCAHHRENRTYAAGFWGITASDTPDGYGAQSPADGQNDGTVSPSAMLASLAFTPDVARLTLAALEKRRDRLWGRYGFVDAFNLQRDWFDRDVIGIDLGMLLLLIENARTGLIWHLLGDDPTIRRGLTAAGFPATVSMPTPSTRPLSQMTRPVVRRFLHTNLDTALSPPLH